MKPPARLRPTLLLLLLLLLTAAALPVRADPFRLGVWVRDAAGRVVDSQRIWYGDGEVYIGTAIPTTVKMAFNITFTDTRTLLLDITPDISSPASIDTPLRLPDPTFLAVHTVPADGAAAEPLFFTHSALTLRPTDVYLWTRADGVLYPQTRAGPAPGTLCLGPTSALGTFRLLWAADDAAAASQGLQRAVLNMRARY